MPGKKIYCLLIWLLLLHLQCRKAYTPAVFTSSDNYLVVDGFVNTSAGGITTLVLSRTKKITDTTVASLPEPGARVLIQTAAGTSYQLQDTAGSGVYTSSPLLLSNAGSYRVLITTAAGRQYQSAYVQARPAPAIDSVHWVEDDGIRFFVNTHDPQNATRFYRWQYELTWEYHAQFNSPWAEANGMIYVKNPTDATFFCYRTLLSTDILLGNSSALAQDVISSKLLYKMQQNDSVLNYRISMLVKQYALSPEAYFYWQIIQKNSQQLGTLFDLQPSQLEGNIHSVSDPAEPVIGFLSAGTEATKRIDIRFDDLTTWVRQTPGYSCEVKGIPENPASFLIYSYPDPEYGPYYFSGGTLFIAKKTCLDCRLSGGTTVKPAFW